MASYSRDVTDDAIDNVTSRRALGTFIGSHIKQEALNRLVS